MLTFDDAVASLNRHNERNRDRWALTLCPDGVYRVDGRMVPSADHPAVRIDHCEAVVGIHGRVNKGERGVGAQIGAHVEQRELKLVPLP